MTKLGIDWKLLIAQILNFLVLLFVLWRFVYKPLVKLLEDRSKKIEKGIKDAEAAKQTLKLGQKKQEEIIRTAKKEAQKIIEKAVLEGKKIKEELEKEASLKAQEIIDASKIQIQKEKEAAINEVKKEIGGIVALAVEKIIDEKMTEQKDKQLIRKFLS